MVVYPVVLCLRTPNVGKFEGDQMAKFLTLSEIVKQAQLNLDKGAWDYLIGGADTESALRRNRAGVNSWVFKPRI